MIEYKLLILTQSFMSEQVLHIPWVKQRNGQCPAAAAAIKAATMARTKQKHIIDQDVILWAQINLKGKENKSTWNLWSTLWCKIYWQFDVERSISWSNKFLPAIWRGIEYYLAKGTRNKNYVMQQPELFWVIASWAPSMKMRRTAWNAQ